MQLKERAQADQEQAVQRENHGVRRRIKAILTEHGPERSAERLAARQEQRAANGDAAAAAAVTMMTTTTKDNKERLANQPADQSTADLAPTTSTAAPAKLVAAAALTRGHARAPVSGTGSELPQDRSDNAPKTKPDRPRRRSLGTGNTVRSVGAPRRKRRTSVDGGGLP